MKLSNFIIQSLCPPAAWATAAWQFDSSFRTSLVVTNGCVTSWSATSGTVAVSPCHDATNGWVGACASTDGISFAATVDGVPSPLCFPDSATVLVSRAFIVADGDGAAFCSTLLDAPCPLRLVPSGEGATHHFATSSVLSSIALSIDFSPSNGFSTGLHLYEMELAEACQLCDLYIGGSPASSAWNRSWNGSIGEIILASPAVTQADAALIRSYLSLKWGIGTYRSGTSGKAAALRALGIRTGNPYSSKLLIR